MRIIIALCLLAVAAKAGPQYGVGHAVHHGVHGVHGIHGGLGGHVVHHAAHGGHGLHGGPDYYAPAYYGFQYGVHDPYYGANFGHQEQRDGHVTRGSYFVDLPDGRRQKVTYTADQYGYHPVVTYEGHAHHGHH